MFKNAKTAFNKKCCFRLNHTALSILSCIVMARNFDSIKHFFVLCGVEWREILQLYLDKATGFFLIAIEMTITWFFMLVRNKFIATCSQKSYNWGAIICIGVLVTPINLMAVIYIRDIIWYTSTKLHCKVIYANLKRTLDLKYWHIALNDAGV